MFLQELGALKAHLTFRLGWQLTIPDAPVKVVYALQESLKKELERLQK